MRKALISTTLLVIAALLLGACNLPSTGGTPPTAGPNLVQTAAAQTVSAMETQIAQVPTATPPPAVVATATATQAAATATQYVVATATQGAPTATSIPCDRAGFVKDVTIPDDTMVAPNQAFTKTWRLKNTGSCTWTTSYKVVFDSGNALGGPASVNLPASVAPGQEIDLSVDLKAPSDAKSYQGFWKLQNASGVKFGLGPTADKSFWVKVTVGTTQAPFAVTSGKITVNTDNATKPAGDCKYTFEFKADLTTSAGGKVTYYWEIPGVVKTDVQTLDYSSGGTKTVTFSKEITTAGDYSVRIYNDNPNHQFFNGPSFKLSCTP